MRAHKECAETQCHFGDHCVACSQPWPCDFDKLQVECDDSLAAATHTLRGLTAALRDADRRLDRAYNPTPPS